LLLIVDVVEVREASFRYGRLKALDNLSLQIPAGISFGLLGPNGAGKTTLIRVLVGLLRLKQGTVRVLGDKLSRKMAHRVGYMPQCTIMWISSPRFTGLTIVRSGHSGLKKLSGWLACGRAATTPYLI